MIFLKLIAFLTHHSHFNRVINVFVFILEKHIITADLRAIKSVNFIVIFNKLAWLSILHIDHGLLLNKTDSVSWVINFSLGRLAISFGKRPKESFRLSKHLSDRRPERIWCISQFFVVSRYYFLLIIVILLRQIWWQVAGLWHVVGNIRRLLNRRRQVCRWC